MKGKELLEAILECYADVQDLLVADGLEEAVIGIDVHETRLIYSQSECVRILMERDDMELTEAMEFLEFNTFCAYMGEHTPIWCNDLFY